MTEPYLSSPPDWTQVTLDPDPSSGFIMRVGSGGTPSTSNEENWDGDIPWLTPKEITGSGRSIFVTSTERTITQDGLKGSGAKLLPINTVMLTKRAPVGAVAVNAVPMANNQGFLNFQCGPLLRPLYLAYWFQTNKPYLDAVANGSTYPELYMTDLFEFILAVPPLHIQDQIIRIVNALQLLSYVGLPLEQAISSPDKLIRVQQQNKRLAKIKVLMLPLLLSGDLDTQNVMTEFSLEDMPG